MQEHVTFRVRLCEDHGSRVSFCRAQNARPVRHSRRRRPPGRCSLRFTVRCPPREPCPAPAPCPRPSPRRFPPYLLAAPSSISGRVTEPSFPHPPRPPRFALVSSPPPASAAKSSGTQRSPVTPRLAVHVPLHIRPPAVRGPSRPLGQTRRLGRFLPS